MGNFMSESAKAQQAHVTLITAPVLEEENLKDPESSRNEVSTSLYNGFAVACRSTETMISSSSGHGTMVPSTEMTNSSLQPAMELSQYNTGQTTSTILCKSTETASSSFQPTTELSHYIPVQIPSTAPVSGSSITTIKPENCPQTTAEPATALVTNLPTTMDKQTTHSRISTENNTALDINSPITMTKSAVEHTSALGRNSPIPMPESANRPQTTAKPSTALVKASSPIRTVKAATEHTTSLTVDSPTPTLKKAVAGYTTPFGRPASLTVGSPTPRLKRAAAGYTTPSGRPTSLAVGSPTSALKKAVAGYTASPTVASTPSVLRSATQSQPTTKPTAATMAPCKAFNDGKCRDSTCSKSHRPDKFSIQLRPNHPNICKSFLLYHDSCDKTDCPYSHNLKAAGMPLLLSDMFCETVKELRKLEDEPNASRARLLRLLNKKPKKTEKIDDKLLRKLLLRRDPEAIVCSPMGPVICRDFIIGENGCTRDSCSYSHDLTGLKLATRDRFDLILFIDSMHKYYGDYYGNGRGFVEVKVYNVEFTPMSNGERHNIDGLNGAEIVDYLLLLDNPRLLSKEKTDGLAAKMANRVIKGAGNAKKQATSNGPVGASRSVQTSTTPIIKAPTTTSKSVQKSSITPAIKAPPSKKQATPKLLSTQPSIQPIVPKKPPREIKALATALSEALGVESLEGLDATGILDMIDRKKQEVTQQQGIIRPTEQTMQQPDSMQRVAARGGTTSAEEIDNVSTTSTVTTAATIATIAKIQNLVEETRKIASSSSKKSTSSKPKPTYKDGDIVGASAPVLGVENRGRVMLEKMGWNEGEALGVTNGEDEEGMTRVVVPIEQRVKLDRRGLR